MAPQARDSVLVATGRNGRTRDDFSRGESIARAVDRRRPGSRACLAAREVAAGQGDLGFCCRVGGVFNARLPLWRAPNRPGFEPRCDRGAEERNRSPGTMHTYMPILWKRKAFGWVITTLNGQLSIDNHDLLVAATQGLTGLGLFPLIRPGSLVRL
jgi:hypothetical protein